MPDISTTLYRCRVWFNWWISDKNFDNIMQTKYCNRKLSLTYNGTIMNQKAKDYIRRNTLDLESDNRMDSTGYVQYAISEAKAYAAIVIAEEEMRQKAIEAFKFAVDGYFIIGGTDYSARRLNEFIKKLDS